MNTLPAIPVVQQAFCVHPLNRVARFTEWDKSLWVNGESRIVRRSCSCLNCGKVWVE